MPELQEKYSTVRGKLNHLEAKEECRKIPQKEISENKCRECGRLFYSPYLLREHQRYICIQQETEEVEEAEEELEKAELARQKE